MKIYNYVRINIDTNEIVEEDSFEYNGKISECKGGSVSVPEPTAEEKELQKEILTQLKESRTLQEKFLPILMETSGYKYDDSGNVVKMGYDEYLDSLDPTMRTQYENLQLIQEQAQKALQGEIASPLLEKSLSSQKQQMEENLSRRLGSNWGQTSAGLLAQQEYNTGADIAREQVRNNAINTYGGLGLSGNEAYNLTPASQLQTASGVAMSGTSLLPYYSSALQPYQNQRDMQLKANIQNAQNSSNQLSSLYRSVGGLVGIGLGSYLSSGEK